MVVLFSIAAYQRLLAAAGNDTWRTALDRALQIGRRIRIGLGYRVLHTNTGLHRRAMDLARQAGLAATYDAHYED